jgi:hypothetical protein
MRMLVDPYFGCDVVANVGNFQVHHVPERVQSLVYPVAK